MFMFNLYEMYLTHTVALAVMTLGGASRPKVEWHYLCGTLQKDKIVHRCGCTVTGLLTAHYFLSVNSLWHPSV